MKKILSMIALTVLMVALAGSCTKNFEERLDKTDADVATLQAAIGKYGELQSDITTVLQALRAEVGARPASEQQSVWNCINALQNQSNALDVAIRNLQKLVGETSVDAQISEAVENLVSEYDLDNLEATLQELKEKVNAKYDVTELEKKVGQLKEKLDKVVTSILKISAIEEMIQSVSIAPAYSDGSVRADEENNLTFKCIVSPAEALAGESNLEECFTIARLEVEPATKKASNKYIKVTEVRALDKNQGAYKVTANIIGLPDENESLMIALNVKTGLSDYTTDFVKVTLPFRRPAGALPGEFTVNAGGKRVCFSQGNLFWDGSAFNFESAQYEIQTSWSTSHVSHFYWSKNASVATAQDFSESGATDFAVFFTNATTETAKSDFTVNGVNGKYRTLSAEEWQYLFNNHSYKWASVNGVNGYVLAPDGFVGTLSDSYSDDAALAADNLVFLPTTGARDGSRVQGQDSDGYYWSSSLKEGSGRNAFVVWLGSSLVQHTSLYCGFGSSVRLVTDVEN